MSRDRDKYRKYLSGNEKRVKRAKIELENNIMRGSLKRFINNSSSNNVILTSTNEKPANDDHTEVQNEHNDTLCKTDDKTIKVSIFVIFIMNKVCIILYSYNFMYTLNNKNKNLRPVFIVI